jgi:SAM-dependent methyltransferase
MFGSTSFFNINADHRLSKWSMRFFMAGNRLNNSFPYSLLDKRLRIKNFSLNEQELKKFWPLTEIKSSPSRKLSDLLWLSLPWNKIKEELGKINIFDIGCGSGNYGKFFINKANAEISSYVGIDSAFNKNWPELEREFPNFKFHEGNSRHIFPLIPKNSNLLISQSAIEHFKKDISFFKQIRKFILSEKKPVLQIHLFPSAACLSLYRGHGFREYTPRNISKISSLFSNFSDCFLFNLGDKNCNRLHFDFITKPKYITRSKDRRELETENYNSELLSAIKKSFSNPFKKPSPSFYALVIYSFKNNDIF